jgi:hypothetical protein
MILTNFQRSIGPLWQLSLSGWRITFGRCTDENHTLYSSGKVWFGAPYQRTITVHVRGFAFTVTQLRRKARPHC